MTFLSTQMRPLEEAQRARTQILNGAPVKTTYVPEELPQLPVHLQADAQGSHTISLVGALHGEFAPLVPMGLLAPLDDQEAPAEAARHSRQSRRRSRISAASI